MNQFLAALTIVSVCTALYLGYRLIAQGRRVRRLTQRLGEKNERIAELRTERDDLQTRVDILTADRDELETAVDSLRIIASRLREQPQSFAEYVGRTIGGWL